MTDELGFEIQINQPYEQALETVIAALKGQGFGVLTRIDVRATLKEKLGKDFRPYTILGACNPPLAYRALEQAAEVGLMLPCNVTVEESQAGQSIVRIANPKTMILAANRSGDEVLQQVADEAYDKMQKVFTGLKEQKAPEAV